MSAVVTYASIAGKISIAWTNFVGICKHIFQMVAARVAKAPDIVLPGWIEDGVIEEYKSRTAIK
jgi:hypothetical protein